MRDSTYSHLFSLILAYSHLWANKFFIMIGETRGKPVTDPMALGFHRGHLRDDADCQWVDALPSHPSPLSWGEGELFAGGYEKLNDRGGRKVDRKSARGLAHSGTLRAGRRSAVSLTAAPGRGQLVGQTQARDFEDFRQRRLNFLLAGILEAPLEPGQDGLLAVKPGANDKGEAEFLLVGLVISLEHRNLLRRKLVQAGTGLFLGGGGGEGAGQRGPAHEVGMGANERELLFVAGGPDGGAEFRVQVVRDRQRAGGARWRRRSRGNAPRPGRQSP